MDTGVDAKVDDEKELKKFEKYQKQGVDLAFRCNSCGKIVVNSDILFQPHGCRRCGSRRVYPITAELTWFGLQYCRFFSWLHDKGIDDA